MPKYVIKNPTGNVARELKPGLGTFTIPAGGSITVDNKELAESLVNDSHGKLVLEKVITDAKVPEVKPAEKTQTTTNQTSKETEKDNKENSGNKDVNNGKSEGNK